MLRTASVIVLATVGILLANPDQSVSAHVTELNVTPAASPRPALRYRLLPPVTELKEGNAAVSYLRAMSPDSIALWSNSDSSKNAAELLKGPAKDVPIDVTGFRVVLAELHRAARMSSCDYQYTMDRMREEGYALVLPDLQTHREMSVLLSLNARYHLGEKNFDEAARVLQTNLAMARHINQGPTLIHALVGTSIATVALNQVDEWIQTPGSPNLYWALTALPIQFLDLSRALQAETLSIEWMLPCYRDLEKIAFNERDLEKIAKDALDKASKISELKFDETEFKQFVEARYEASRKHLLANGRTEEQLKPFCKLQVVILYELDLYFATFDNLLNCCNLPYWEAVPKLKCVSDQLAKREGLLVSFLAPALDKVYAAIKRVDRRIAILRTAEAVRAYVAATGKLPAKLEDLDVRSVKTDCPAALDPMTGKLFSYEVREGKVVHLIGEAHDLNKNNPLNTIEYVLEFKMLKK